LPMKLLVGTAQEFEIAGEPPFAFGHERDVERRGLRFRDRDLSRLKQQAARFALIFAGRDQQSWTARRRERNARLKLGVIAPAGARERFGPAVVKDVFTVGMALQIERQSRDRSAFTFKQQMDRPPAGLRRCRTGLFQRCEKSVSREGIGPGLLIRIGEPIPGRGVDAANLPAEPCRNLAHAIANIASISTAAPRGNEEQPTAERACRPSSPNTSTNRSDAPLITSG